MIEAFWFTIIYSWLKKAEWNQWVMNKDKLKIFLPLVCLQAVCSDEQWRWGQVLFNIDVSTCYDLHFAYIYLTPPPTTNIPFIIILWTTCNIITKANENYCYKLRQSNSTLHCPPHTTSPVHSEMHCAMLGLSVLWFVLQLRLLLSKGTFVFF